MFHVEGTRVTLSEFTYTPSIESVAFVNQLMHSVTIVIDVKILLYKSLIDTHLDLYLTRF